MNHYLDFLQENTQNVTILGILGIISKETLVMLVRALVQALIQQLFKRNKKVKKEDDEET